jgi:hypothetical protein
MGSMLCFGISALHSNYKKYYQHKYWIKLLSNKKIKLLRVSADILFVILQCNIIVLKI